MNSKIKHQKSSEIVAFNFFSESGSERGLDFFRQHPEDFLQKFAPNRLRILRNALRKINFKFEGKFVADLFMPMNVGGYFTPGRKPPILAINPNLLLSGTEKEIAHVIFHESQHAEGIMEEVVVETMTKKKMAELYGGATFRSGYDGMVDEASEFFGDLSFADMQNLIEEKDDEETFDNFLQLILVEPAIGNTDISGLSWEGLMKKFQKKWDMLSRLFPRMINKIAKNGAGLHEEAKMNAYQFKLEGVLEKTAFRIFEEHPEIITELFMKVTKDGEENMDADKIRELLMKEGYGYIYDKEPKAMNRMIDNFILSVNLQKLINKDEKVKAEEVNLEIVA